jgi:hypothetical protein
MARRAHRLSLMKSRLTRVSLPFVIAIMSLGTGCSSGKNALEKRVASLQEELVALQNTNDGLSERMTAIEMRQMRSAGVPSRAESDEPSQIDRPPLKVVRMGPGARAPDPSEDPEAAIENGDDGAERPMIRDLGSGKQARPRASGGGLRQTGER